MLNFDNIIDRWADALRSNRYLRGFGGLRHENLYCPLGVLADQLDPDAWVFVDVTWRWRPTEIADDGSVGILPLAVWVQVPVALNQGELIRASDSAHLSFGEIADLIQSRRTDK